MFPFSGRGKNIRVRAITQADSRPLLRLVRRAWRVYLRIPPFELESGLSAYLGFVTEDEMGLRGFILAETQYPELGLIVAVGLRDIGTITPYIEQLLPPLEQAVQARDLPTLAFVGRAEWLTEAFIEQGFSVHEWVVGFARPGSGLSPRPGGPAWLRLACYNDLPTLLELDRLAFEQRIWHNSLADFRHALSRATSFVVAELAGQVVGYAWLELRRGHAHLSRLAVHPGYQGQGIGGQLLHRAITDALEAGARHIPLNTQENNYRSHALYRRFGFKLTGRWMPVLHKKL